MKIKLFLTYLLYGVQWGCTWLVIQTALTVFFTGSSNVLNPDTFLVSVFSAILAGIGGAGFSIVYTFENWSFKKQTTIHFIGGMSLFFIAAYIGKWIDFTFTPVLLFFVVGCIFTHWIIWTIFYIINTKISAKHINEKLKKMRDNNSNLEK